MNFKLPDIPYSYDALEPHIDSKTMEIHHTKHHGAYTNNLNMALKDSPLEGASIEDILFKGIENASIRNNAGGFYNHNLFWRILKPNKGTLPSGKIAEEITAIFKSFEGFKETFTQVAMSRFGSGWAWLYRSKEDKKLKISSTANQDNPLMPIKGNHMGNPILGLDLWEHAYYLKYQNRRADYITSFWEIVNWDEVALLDKEN